MHVGSRSGSSGFRRSARSREMNEGVCTCILETTMYVNVLHAWSGLVVSYSMSVARVVTIKVRPCHDTSARVTTRTLDSVEYKWFDAKLGWK